MDRVSPSRRRQARAIAISATVEAKRALWTKMMMAFATFAVLAEVASVTHQILAHS